MKEKEINYYWYHHMMPINMIEKIQKIINEHNYFEFIEWYKKLNSEGIKQGIFNEEFQSFYPIIYLPDTASYWNEEQKKFQDINILEKENFLKITYSECECG